MKIAITADLHWGHRHGTNETRALVDHLNASPPDLLILAGDLGTRTLFDECLALFANLTCPKALVPGNHDVWVERESERDSLQRYEEDLPRACEEQGFHYLDHSPLYFEEEDLAIVGTMNWYDYSWSEDRLRELHPKELERLESKRFIRGRHNDAKFVRSALNDREFTTLMVDRFEDHLLQAKEKVGHLIVITHHPPYYGLGFPRLCPPIRLDSLLWDAFCGNRRMEDFLTAQQDYVDFVFCGHVHRKRKNRLGKIRGFNVGSDYDFKRLMLLDWPEGTVEAIEFGDVDEEG